MEIKKCKVEWCENKYNKHWAKGMCTKHYSQIHHYGKILERTKFDKNEYIDCGDYYEICLYNIKHKEIARALIDKNDYKKIKDYKWYLDHYGYVNSMMNGKVIKIHQLILGKKDGYVIDHKDRNPLNNKKNNIRHATKSQNGMNKQCKGYYIDEYNKYHTQIVVNGKNIYLGYFKKEKDAIKARKEAEIKYYGEFRYQQQN